MLEISHAHRAVLPQPPIRGATEADLSFLMYLNTKYSQALGFMPREALRKYIADGLVRLVEQNGQPAGFTIKRTKLGDEPGIVPVVQAAVAMDAQRRHLGLALIETLARDARRACAHVLQAWCAADLEANDFWRACNFQEIGRRVADNKSKRELILWRRSLTTCRPDLMSVLPQRAGCYGKSLDPTTFKWSKHVATS